MLFFAGFLLLSGLGVLACFWLLAFRGPRAAVVPWPPLRFPRCLRGFDSRPRLRCATSPLLVLLNVGGPAA
ncbi:hypothetical protein C3R30_21235, partial [Mycobacterium tuberculosis]